MEEKKKKKKKKISSDNTGKWNRRSEKKLEGKRRE